MQQVFHAEIDSKKLQASLDAIMQKAGTVRPWLKRMGERQIKSKELNYKSQGRRYQSGGWALLSEMTIRMRQWRQDIAEEEGSRGHRFTGKILEVSGALRRDWEYAVTGDGPAGQVDIGSPLPYAQVHQDGGTYPAPPWVKWKTKSTVDIPQRILMAIADPDWKRGQFEADKYLKEIHGE